MRGSIFVTRSGQAVRRQNVWADMKSVCAEAGVLPSKVYPHNLRHLFAKIFYERDHDLVRLADYLGHSSVETTRRYTIISSREACRRQLELGFASAEYLTRHPAFNKMIIYRTLMYDTIPF